MSWKKRSKEQPNRGSNVLVYNGSIYLASISWEGVAKVMNNNEWTPVDQFNEWSHWMDLPKPPEQAP